MRRFAFTACFALLSAISAALGAPAFDPAPMDAAAKTMLERLNYQGAAVIVDDNGVAWSFYNGSTDCTANGPRIRAADRFDMGSVTKLFTSALILRLVERRELSLDARLGALLPNVPADKAGITVLQLLTHTAGLREASGLDEVYLAREPMLAQEFSAPLLFPPGTKNEYSNVGYSVLAAIIETRYRAPYEVVVQRELLAPLKITSIGYGRAAGPGVDVCGYWDGRANPRYGSVRDYHVNGQPSWNVLGNGAMVATPEDLARWIHALVKGRVLGPESTALVRDAMARDWHGRPVYLTSGSNIVFTTFAAHYRDTGLTFLMMSSDSRAPKERAMLFFNQGLNPLMDKLAPKK